MEARYPAVEQGCESECETSQIGVRVCIETTRERDHRLFNQHNIIVFGQSAV